MRDARILQDHAGELPRAPAANHPLIERCAASSVVLLGGRPTAPCNCAMVRGDHRSWNLHEQRMAATLQALRDRLAEQVDTLRLVVWAHNAHVGDAAATEMGRRGGYTLGQLLRERHPGEVVSVGMTTHTGVVTATHGDAGPPHRMRVLEAIPGSYEELFHAVGRDRFWLSLADERVRAALSDARLERGIGVAYHPEDERARHYFGASLAHQFDIVCHIDRTSALEPDDQIPAQDWEERHGADRRRPLRGPDTPRLVT